MIEMPVPHKWRRADDHGLRLRCVECGAHGFRRIVFGQISPVVYCWEECTMAMTLDKVTLKKAQESIRDQLWVLYPRPETIDTDPKDDRVSVTNADMIIAGLRLAGLRIVDVGHDGADGDLIEMLGSNPETAELFAKDLEKLRKRGT